MITLKTDFGNLIWNFFMLPFFIGSGLILIIGAFIVDDLLYIPIGAISLGVGIFLIWLDKKYDLDDNTIEESTQ